MAEPIRILAATLPSDTDRGPASNCTITHTLAQFVVTALLVMVILASLVQWNTIEVGDGEMPGPALAAGAVAHPTSAARALAARLRTDRQSERWRVVDRGHVTRRGLASLLIELNRSSDTAAH